MICKLKKHVKFSEKFDKKISSKIGDEISAMWEEMNMILSTMVELEYVCVI
jgi:hypothetical protein